MEAVLPEVLPGEKAKTAGQDQQRDGPPDQRVAHIAGQGGEGGAGPHQVKAGITEGGDRMEDSIPQPLEKAELGAEAEGQEECAGPLDEQHGLQDKASHAHDPAHLWGGDGLLHHPALSQADFPAGEHHNGYSHGDHPHAASLDQGQKDQMAEGGPVGGGVVDD